MQTTFNGRDISKLNVGEYIARFLNIDWKKLGAVEDLLKFLMATDCKRILSVGSGGGVLEYLIREYAKIEQFPISMHASDLSDLHVELAQNAFPDMKFYRYNFCTEPISQFLDESGPIDAILSFGSLYVMDDDELTAFLNQAAETSIRYVIDFHAGCVLEQEYLQVKKTSEIIMASVAELQQHSPYSTYKFHGYVRMPGQLFQLYQDAGWQKCRKLNGAGIYKFAMAFQRPPSN